MKVIKNIKIINKIFCKEDILNIVKDIFIELKRDKSKYKRYELVLNCDDGATYEYNLKDGNTSDFINSVLLLRNIRRIEACYRNYDNDRTINLRIEIGDSNYSFDNSVNIIGNTEVWAYGKYKYYEDLINNVTNKNKYIGRLITLTEHLFYVATGFSVLLLVAVISKVVGYIPNNEKNLLYLIMDRWIIIRYVVLVLICDYIGMTLSLFIKPLNFEWLRKIFPSVDIEWGGNRISKKAKIINSLKGFFQLIAIPLLLGLVSRVIENLFRITD